MYSIDTNLTFQSIFDDQMDKLICKNSIKNEYPSKHTFLMPGDKMNYIYYLKQGQTKHYMINSDGAEKILYKLTPGWFYGETAFFLDNPTGLYSQTETDSVLYKIKGELCRKLFEENKLFAESILKCCCSKLLILRYEVESLTFNSCKDRIKRFYCASVDKNSINDGSWYNIKVQSTHYEIGIIIGAARVTVSKLINELCEEGFIRVINRNVEVNIRKYEKYVRR